MKRAMFALIFLCSILVQGQTPLQILPTTTLAIETSNNTSTADAFAGTSNGNQAATNISKESMRGLLYSGSNTRILAYQVPWFGPSNHVQVGYNSSDPIQINKQIDDMMSRGITGQVINWYGVNSTFIETATERIKTAAEQHAGFGFLISYDGGALKNATDPAAKLISDLNYVAANYYPSSAYIKVNGRPLITFFSTEQYNMDWNRIRSGVKGNPLFIFRNSGGFTKAQSDGAFAWIGVGNPATMNYLNDFYYNALKNPTKVDFGGVYKGFNDSIASWGANRLTPQNCGQTWLQTWAALGTRFSSTNQLTFMEINTWNDYEEGHATEMGIDNCVTITSALANKVLAWAITGQENTLAHFSIFISLNGQNLMPLVDVPASQRSLDMGGYLLAPGTYQLFVKAVGKPSLNNHMSGVQMYTVPNQPPTVSLTASPAAGSAPLAVTLSGIAADSDGTIASTLLDFGDGSKSPLLNAIHTYTPGVYQAVASVTDNLGASAASLTMVTAYGLTLSPINAATTSSPVTIQSTFTAKQSARVELWIDYKLKSSVNGATGVNTVVTFTVGSHRIAVVGVEADGTIYKLVSTITVK